MFFFWQNPFTSLGTLSWCRDGCWQRKWCRGSCLGEETKSKSKGRGNLLTVLLLLLFWSLYLSFYLPNPELRSVSPSYYILLCKLRHTLSQGIRDWPLWDYCRKSHLSVCQTASTAGVAKAFCLLPPCPASFAFIFRTTLKSDSKDLGRLRFLKGNTQSREVQLWSNHSRTVLRLVHKTCVPHHLQTTTCSHSGDLPAMWDSAGVTGQRTSWFVRFPVAQGIFIIKLLFSSLN